MKKINKIPIFLEYKKKLNKNTWYITATLVGKDFILPTVVKTIKGNKKKLNHLFIKNQEYVFLSRTLVNVLYNVKKDILFYINCDGNKLFFLSKAINFLGKGHYNYNNEKQLTNFSTKINFNDKQTYTLNFKQTQT